MIAASFVGRGRSYAQLSAYAEASITRYRIVSILDSVTTPVCRFLDGKTVSVSNGLRLFDQVEFDPERMVEINPWVRETVDRETGKRMLSVERDGGRVSIAEIVRSGIGTNDDRGEFARGMGESELDTLGVGFPPYHCLCRTGTVAV